MAAKKKTTTRTKKKAAKAASVIKKPKARKAAPEPKAPSTSAPPLGGITSAEEGRLALDAIVNTVTEDGRRLAVPVHEAPNPHMLRRPCGIMELDIDLGGGPPAGGACFISGPDNSGKTWLLLRYLAMQQKLYGQNFVGAYVIGEGTFPFDQAIKAGLVVPYPEVMIQQWQQARMERGLPLFSEDELMPYRQGIGRLEIIRGAYGEEMLDMVIRLVSTNVVSIIGIDSLNSLNPLANLDKSLEDNDKRAAHAMMMQRFFSMYIPYTRGLYGLNNTTLLMTQQVRANPQKATAPAHIQQYLKDWAISGGYAMKHYKLIDLILWDGEVKKKDVKGVGKVAFGKVMKWATEKGKAGTHDNITGEVLFRYDLPGNVDFQDTVIVAGQKRGVIQQVKNKVCIIRPDGTEVTALQARNYANMKKMMEMDFEYELAVRREVLAAAGIQCLYR